MLHTLVHLPVILVCVLPVLLTPPPLPPLPPPPAPLATRLETRLWA
jgi:hypothetical protein